MAEAIMRFLPELGALGLALQLFLLTVVVGGSSHDEPGAASQARHKRAAELADRLGVLGAVVVFALALFSLDQRGSVFFDAYAVGGFSQLAKAFIAGGLVGGLWLVRGARGVPERDRPELVLFLVLSALGMMMLVSANDLVTFYVVLELAAYSLYIVVPLASGHGHHNEASFKYFLYGAALSAVSLLGMAILYGMAGSTSIPEIAAAMSAAPSVLGVVALLLTLVGILFKLSVFPFHFWAPDVYQHSDHGVAAFIAGTSKMGAIAALLRLLLMGVDLPQMSWLIGGLAVASMTYGNLAAIAQKDLKRLLAYSGIAQGGYVLLGLIGLEETGYAAAMYYGLGYVGLMFLLFLVIVELDRAAPAEDGERGLKISALRGLHSRSPFLAAALLVGLLGLAGVPPTIGFTGKWLLFKAALENGGFWLVLLAGVNNTIAVYYYLIALKAAYVDEPGDAPPAPVGGGVKTVGAIVMVAAILGGVFPQWLMPGILDAVRAMM